jgi:hypothetical protein
VAMQLITSESPSLVVMLPPVGSAPAAKKN